MTSFSLSLIALVLGLVTLLLVWTFRRPNRIPPATLQAHPASHKLVVSGVELHFLRKGRGEPLLLLHGIGASTFTWRFLIEKFAQDFDVIALDLPGFGDSEKPLDFNYGLDGYTQIVQEFLARLQVSTCYVVGSSMGGTIALNLLRSTPQKIVRVAALAPAIHPKVVPPGLMALLPAHRILQRSMNERTMKTIMSLVYSRKELITGDTVREALRPFQTDSNSIAVFLKATSTFRDPRLPQLFEDIEQSEKVLLCRGNKDLMVTQKSIMNLSRLLNVPVYNHPLAGHHPHEDEPDWTARLVRDFFFAPPGQWPQNPV